MSILQWCLIIVLAPLVGSVVAGFFRKQIGRVGAHSITIAGVGLSLVLSVYVAVLILTGSEPVFNSNLYTWASGGDLFPYAFYIGFMIDPLTVVMMVIVTFVSFLVHIYSIGSEGIGDSGWAKSLYCKPSGGFWICSWYCLGIVLCRQS